METSYGSVSEAPQRKRGATDRPDLRVWRQYSTVPRGVGEEFVGSYLYGRLLSGYHAHIKVKRLVCRFADCIGQLRRLNGVLRSTAPPEALPCR
jgi:hypothetical protein